MEGMLNKLNDNIIILNKDGIIRFCNEKLIARLGYCRDEVENNPIHKIISNFKFLSNKDLSKDEKNNVIYLCKNKKVILIESTISQVEWKEEVCYCILGSEVVKVSKKERSRVLINNILKYANDCSEPLKLSEEIKNEMLEVLGADIASVYVYDNDVKALIPILRLHEENEAIGDINIIKVEDDQLERIKKQEIINDIKLEDYKKYSNRCNLPDLGIQCLRWYSIINNNVFLGILNVAYKSKDNYKEIETDLIEDICNIFAILIVNYRVNRSFINEMERSKLLNLKLEGFLATSADLMVITDERGKFIKVKTGSRYKLEWSEEELLEFRGEDLLHPEDFESFMKTEYKSIISGELRRYGCRELCKNGVYRWLEWRYIYVEENGTYVATAIDVTEEKMLVEQRKIYEESIQLDHIRNEFFSKISHELKTPLNIILSGIQLIDDIMNKDTEFNYKKNNLKKYNKSIKQNAFRLLRLVNNIIDVTKIDIGSYNVKLENINIVYVVENIVTEVAEYIKGNQKRIIFDTDVEEMVIACDPELIERIMLNLISNAIKFTGVNGLINVNLEVKDNFLMISIIDNGIGIPKEKLDIIFDIFSQVDNSFARKCEGSGIGLSLVRAFVEMHEGYIWGESEIEKGSKFIFKIPIKLISNNTKNNYCNNIFRTQREKCKIEFSDIYELV